MTAPTERRRGRGRPPGARGTGGARDAILAAARRRFAEDGYGRATVRAVARDAGVDPALVIHYFGSKADLFAAAVDLPVSPSDVVERLTAVPVDRLGEAVVRAALALWGEPGTLDAWVGLVRAAMADEAAAASLRDFVTNAIVEPLVARLDGVGVADGPLRGTLVASQVVGLGVARHIVGLEPLASLGGDGLVAAYAPTLQRYLTGPLTA